MKSQKTKTISKDPLWDQTPEMGHEALIATIYDSEELMAALKKNIINTRIKLGRMINFE
jgi:hypothetical protein